jgi:MFS transporter, ACS family, glucarate transporter
VKSSWRVVALLCLVTGVAYLVRTDITVAQERMAPALGLSMADMGAITAWAFQLSYALAQVPAGIFGERFGARQTLALALAGGAVASLATGLMPEWAATATLTGTRVLLGIAQAAVFPVAAMAVAQYVAREHQMRANALHMASSSLGSAIAPLMMAPIMLQFGWRAVFILSGILGATAAIVFFTMMPRRVIASTTGSTRRITGADLLRDTRRLAANSNLRRLSLAYLLHSAVFFVFVFWFFRYLTEGRGFTVLASGVWASLPSAAGFVSGPIIGALADRYGRRVGEGKARRRAAMACLLCSTIMAISGAIVPGAFLAIAALSLSSAGLNGAESPFYTTATVIGAGNPGAAAGLLNLMGNLGGVLSIWLVPRMSDAWGWNGTLLFWAGVAFVAALLWLTVNTDDPATASSTPDVALAIA